MRKSGATLIARAPVRISLAGGGTDLPAYYEQYGGMVVSTTIDKYVYVHCRPNGSSSHYYSQITSADYQSFYRYHSDAVVHWDGDLSLPRAVLHCFGGGRNISLFLASEVPPGTGLGSSSAVAVALVAGVSRFLGWTLSRRHIAEMACHVELEKLAAPIGKQDQFAAAFGGLNAIHFDRGGVRVERISLAPKTASQLESRLMLFFTGTARDSASILRGQQRASAQGRQKTVEGLHRIKEAAIECRRCLENGDLDGVGRLLDEGWREKRRLVAGITSSRLDEIYELAISSGATGGKITGAGGGGFLLLYCQEQRQQQVAEALERMGLRQMDFHLERGGVNIAGVSWGESHRDESEIPDFEAAPSAPGHRAA